MEGRSSRLLEQIKKQNYRNYPIKNTLLESETDYIKNNYFRHLALTLTQKGEASENQRYLFSRMLEGVEAEDKIEDYLRQAMDIEIDQYIEFMDQLKEKEIRYRFLLDAALIICCDIHTEEQEELLACFMETLKISLADAAFICETTRNVLKQDRDRYLGQMNANYGISFRDFAKEYFIDHAGELVRSNELVQWYFPVKKKVSKDMLHAGNVQGAFEEIKEVRIRNAIFDVNTEELTFKKCGKIILEDCEFRGGEYSIHLVMNSEVEFRNCFFTDFVRRAIIVDCSSKASIRFHQCDFKKCYLYYEQKEKSWKQIGGVIGSKANSIFYIENSTFTDCGVINRKDCYASAIILNQKATVRNCCFVNCLGYHSTNRIDRNQIDPNDHRRTMFAPNSINEGNTIIHSARFH